MIIYYLKNEVNILYKKNCKLLNKVWYKLSKIKKFNYINKLPNLDDELIVEKTVNSRVDY